MAIRAHSRAILTLVGMLGLSGCGADLFTVQKAQPLIDLDLKQSATAVATTAERRIILYTPVGSSSPAGGTNSATAVQFCAEPSPDALESIASIFTASASATLGSDSASAALGNALITSADKLFSRSQGVQFFRDGVFALCQAAMNGWVTTAKDSSSANRLVEAILIKKEEKKKKDGTVEVRVIDSTRLVDTDRAKLVLKIDQKSAEGFELDSIRELSEFEVALRFLRQESKEIIIREAETGSLLRPASAATTKQQITNFKAQLTDLQEIIALLEKDEKGQAAGEEKPDPKDGKPKAGDKPKKS